jgi:hypothetical protein
MEIIDGLYNLPKHSRAERVRVVYDAVERARRQALELGNTALRKEFLYEFDRFINKLFNLAGDHPRLSFGKDVILTKDDFGPISLLPLSSTEMKNFPVIRNRAFSEREAQIIERYTNFTLSLRGNEQARLISTSNRDFARNGIDLRIFDNPSAERRRAPLYDTRSDPTPRNPDIAIADEIIMAPGDPFLLEVVDQILANFSGSQEFSDIMKCVLGQMNVADLSSIFTYELATQFGVMVGELGYDFLQDNTLTRITPRPGPGVAPPRYVEYEFTAVAQGARIGPPQEEYKDIQADIKVSKKLLLTHDTENNTVTARFIEGHVQYNLTNTIVQPVPEGEQAQDASQVQGS